MDAETKRPLGEFTFYLATRLKNGRMEVFYDQPQKATCVHALFPHAGYLPCWYLRKSDIKEVYLMHLTDGLHDWLNDGRGDSREKGLGLRNPWGCAGKAGDPLYAFNAPSRA